MIKLQRALEPVYLAQNKTSWLSSLEQAIVCYGGYKSIPRDEKEELIKHYRHKDVKSALESSSNGKCAFCECKPGDSGNVEVEHFNPKSIYHKFIFDWDNLLPICRKCNDSKSNHDTVVDPIVNPYNDDPALFFYFRDISIKPRLGNNYAVAKRTIEVCGLETIRLFKPRAELLVTIRSFMTDLDEAVSRVESADTELKGTIRLRKLDEAIDRIDRCMAATEIHSSFVRAVVENEPAYQKAKQLISVRNN